MDSAIDAINAGIYILEFMEQVVRPALGDARAEHPIGVRIGIDYAKRKRSSGEIMASPEHLKSLQPLIMWTLPQNCNKLPEPITL